MDADVRLQWDSYLSAMEVVDRDPLTGTDLLHWVIKLPVSEPAAAGVCRLHPHHAMMVGPPTCQLVVRLHAHVLQPGHPALAGPQGSHQEAEVREDQREEDVHFGGGAVQRIPQ